MERKSKRQTILIVTWALVLLAGSVAVQIVTQAEHLATLGDALRSILGCGLIVVIAAGVGRALTRGRHLEMPLRVGLGLGVLSALMLALGLIGALRAEIAWLLLGVMVIVSVRSMRALLADLSDALRALAPDKRFERWLMMYSLLMLALAFVRALAPATAWDALVYHLKGPELYLAQGNFAQSIDLPYLGFPQFQEMLYLLARLIGVSNVGLLHWVFAAATVMLLHKQGGWLAAAIYLSAQSIALLAGWPYVDLTLAFFVLAAFVCLRNERFVLAGVFAGFALTTKYTAAPAVLGLFLLVLMRTNLRRVLIFGGVAVLCAAPWYLKNLIVTGNPVYPFFFDAPYWDAWRSQWYSRFGTGLAFTSPLRLLAAPIEATLFGIEGRSPYGATIGPLFLMLVPIGIVYAIRERKQDVRDASIVCAVAYAIWLAMIAMSQLLVQTRLLFPIFPLLAIIAASGFDQLRQSRRLVSGVVSVSLAVTLFLSTLDFGASGTLAWLSGAKTRDDYLTDRLGWYYVSMRELPVDARVMLLWEPRSLYCAADCIPDALLDRWWHARRTIGSAEAIAADWRAQGVTHVLLSRLGYEFVIEAGFDPISDEDQIEFDRLIGSELELVKGWDGVYVLYRLK